ncbi:MAG: AraC family transcriptional regulator [Ferruginibacter sp.]
MHLNKDDTELLAAIKTRIRNNYAEHTNIGQFALDTGFSISKLSRSFRYIYGINLYHFIKTVRMYESLPLLLENRKSLSQVAKAVGYRSSGNFITAFRKHYKYTPYYLRTHPTLLLTIQKRTYKQFQHLL